MAFASLAHLTRRGEVYYFRRAIPKALMPVFGRREIKVSLQTDHRPTATIRCRDMTNAFERLLERVDGMAVLTQEQIESLLRDYFARQWEKAKEIEHICREKLDQELDPVHEAAMSVQEATTLRQRAVGGSYNAANRADVHELLEAHGHAIDNVGLEDISTLCNGILRAQSETHRILAAMLGGRYEDAEPRDPLFKGVKEPKPTPLGDEPPPPPSPQGIPLSELFETWKVGRNAKTVAEFSKGIRRFTELHGDIAAVTINKPMVREFRAALQKLPRVVAGKLRGMTVPQLLGAMAQEPPAATLALGSINKDLGSLSAVLSWGRKEGYFDTALMWGNPVSSMMLVAGTDDEEDREPYDAADLKTIFNSPVYREGKRPAAGGGEAAKWLPLIGLFTGARLEEIGQALVSDIREEGGIPYLDITTLENGRKSKHGKSVKKSTSKRKVPIHPWLVRLGFLAYVADRRKAKDVHLFPDLKPDQFSKRTGNWSKWYGRYVRNLGIEDPRKVFHSFRHGFKAACREAEIEEEVHDGITGHAGGGEGRQYAKGKISMRVLNKAMEQISFDVDLTHLIPKKSG